MATSRADDWRGRGSYFRGALPKVVRRPSTSSMSRWATRRPGAAVGPWLAYQQHRLVWGRTAAEHSLQGVCTRFPGYGFSDKPESWGYTLRRDEELLEYYLSEVIGANAVIVVAHDRGDSVALLHATRCSEGRSAARLEHLVVSNGNIFLPMSQLTDVQRNILDKEMAPNAASLTPARMAEAMGSSTFTPPRGPGEPEVEALAATFGHQDGVKVLHEAIQYLVERSKDEQKWLEVIAKAEIPVTLIWGVYDTVSPPRVANYVWREYLMQRPSRNRLYYIPDANHYSQVDRPDAYAQVVLDAFEPMWTSCWDFSAKTDRQHRYLLTLA